MSVTFEARVGGEGPLPPGAVPMLEVPEDVVQSFRQGKRPKVSVTVGGHTFRSTVAVYGGRYFLPLNKGNKVGAGVELGQRVQVQLELDSAPREVELPVELARALDARPALREAFNRLSYTARREHANLVADARQDETRRRRIERILSELRA